MKKILTILAMLLPLAAFCQSTDADRLSIGVVLPDYENIPAEARQNLESKLQSLVASQGVSDNISAERFLITAKVDVVNKDITQTAPPKVSMKMDVTFIIGDLVEDKIYATHTMSVAGIGVNETKAYITAFQRIKANNPDLLNFVASTKQKILDYYNNNCPFIISEADRKAKMGQYDEALTQLITVPSVCSDCYTQCQTKSLEVYELRKQNEAEKLDKAGRELIRQARSAWSLKHDYECAQQALDLLAQVDPDAACVSEADAFAVEINDHLRKVEAQQAAEAAARAKQEWEFKMRQYEDNVADRRQAQADKAAILGALVNRFGRFDISFKKETTSRWGRAK
ncbi:MAG: hypothetical protein II401_04745 [Bacteroidales bacterium]|nr:hypothetical protein [Bacteroidales bacterium]